MRKTTTLLVILLTISLVIPVLQTTPSATVYQNSNGVVEDTAVRAATPGSDVVVVRVSDDTFTMDEEPSQTHDDFPSEGGLFCGNDSASGGYLARIWLKFYLTHIPENVVFTRATLNLYMDFSLDDADESFGVHFSDNDTWSEDTLTWDNEPNYNPVPCDVIDSPSSPNMFLDDNWYEWEITDEVIQTISEDGILTLILRQVDESLSTPSMKGFVCRETSITDGTNTIPNIALEYEIPTTGNLTVNGFSESPQTEYIIDSTPELGWSFSDGDPSDSQTNYEVEVWNSDTYDDTRLFNESQTHFTTLHSTYHSGAAQTDIFDSALESRGQFLWPASLISHSGVIDKLYFEVDVAFGSTTFDDLAIYLLSGGLNPLTTDFEDNFNGKTPIQVLNRSEYTANIENGYMVFDIENTFVAVSSLNLIIEIRHKGASGTAQGYYSDVGGSTSIIQGPGAWAYHSCVVYTSRTQGVFLELVGEEILSGGLISNSFPFGVSSGSAWRFQYKYNTSLFDVAGTIDKLRFPVTGLGDVVYDNFSVYLLETPVEGELSHSDMDSNYGGQIPTLVLDLDQYTVRNTGKMLVIDIDDIFTYTLTNNLLIELRFDSLISGGESLYFQDDGGAYRAFNNVGYNGNDTGSPDLYIDFVFSEDISIYSGTPLVNGTWYYWRARTCDSLGIWSPWETSSFKYEILTSSPTWSDLEQTGTTVEFGELVTISLDVTHVSGIQQVLIEFDGSNHSMTNEAGDTYKYSWTPASTGSIPWTIYMESYSETWNTIASSVEVEDSTRPTWGIAPYDKVLYVGQSLSIQFTATDLSGIASWSINDTVHFQVIDGLVENIVTLEPGAYPLTVVASDGEGNDLAGSFIVAVIDTSATTTPTTTTPTTSPTTTPTSPVQPPPVDGSIFIIAALAGVIVVLVIIILFQRKTPSPAG